jgi:hypothetical protein
MSQLNPSDMSLVPWWKQRWPWILISGPLVAAIGCAITIWLTLAAVDQPIKDGVVKQGLKVVTAPATTEGPNSVIKSPAVAGGGR